MSSISLKDCVQPFYFEHIAARGALVSLQNSFVEALNGHQYPASINALLGECLLATSLMSTHLKFSARLSIHARSLSRPGDTPAPVSMLTAETHMQRHAADNTSPQQTLSIRGLARLQDSAIAASTSDQAVSLAALLGRAQLAVTIEPDRGERYQGIVNAQASSLTHSLEDYFHQSEQLDTKFYLFTSETQCAGIIMQEMPNHGGKSERSPIGFDAEEDKLLWEELVTLASSIRAEELFTLSPADCLHRLFHQHQYALAAPIPVSFKCSCSRERTTAALQSIHYDELKQLLEEQGEITMDCEFCSTRYRYNHSDIARIKNQPTPIPRKPSDLN